MKLNVLRRFVPENNRRSGNTALRRSRTAAGAEYERVRKRNVLNAMNKVLHANVVDGSNNCESNFHPKLKVNWPTEMDAGDCATRWLIFSESSLCEIISTSESARKQWSRLKWQHYPPLPTELSQKPKNNEKSLRKFLLFGKWDFAFRAHAALEKLSRPPKAVRADEGESAQTGLITTPKANASVETSPFPCSAFLALLVLPATNARSANKANLHKSWKFLKSRQKQFRDWFNCSFCLFSSVRQIFH